MSAIEIEDDVPTGDVSFTIPKMKKISSSRFYKYEEQIVDHSDLLSLNNAINKARFALFELTDAINKYERLEKESKIMYEREWRREYLVSSEKTESARKARADLTCEHLEDDALVNAQVKNDLVRISYTVRIELQTLQTVANNLRQQLKV